MTLYCICGKYATLQEVGMFAFSLSRFALYYTCVQQNKLQFRSSFAYTSMVQDDDRLALQVAIPPTSPDTFATNSIRPVPGYR